MVLRLDGGAEERASADDLGDGKAVGAVGVLDLCVLVDGTLVVLARDTEGDTGGRDGLDLERGTAGDEVLAQQVVGRLAEILRVGGDERERVRALRATAGTHLPGWGDGLRERHGRGKIRDVGSNRREIGGTLYAPGISATPRKHDCI